MVKEYLPAGASSTNDDDEIQQLLSDASLYVYEMTGRDSPMFSAITQFTERQGGTGSFRQFTKNAPIIELVSIQVDGVSIPLSSGYNNPGAAIDTTYNNSIVLIPGFQGSFQTPVIGQFGPSQFRQGIMNIQIVYKAGYSAVPVDLQMAITKLVAKEYMQRQHIGRRQDSDSTSEGRSTITYSKEWAEAYVARVIWRYTRIAGVMR